MDGVVVCICLKQPCSVERITPFFTEILFQDRAIFKRLQGHRPADWEVHSFFAFITVTGYRPLRDDVVGDAVVDAGQHRRHDQVGVGIGT